ncbi:MAG TPA: response regulator, partial [Firmicutes bacterium]|nr:response regulator [Bacillota bacterium]
MKRVLVIEGEVEDRRRLTAELSSHGFDVRACKDGVSAIHELEESHGKSRHFDFVVTDAR